MFDLDLKIFQSYKEGDNNIYLEKTLDFSEQQFSLTASVDKTDPNKNGLKYTMTLDKYLVNGEEKTLEDSDKTTHTTLPIIQGKTENGLASHWAKAFYYYLNVVNQQETTPPSSGEGSGTEGSK